MTSQPVPCLGARGESENASRVPHLDLSASSGYGRTRRYTLCITLNCNLDCAYCYVRKNNTRMSLSTASRALDFIFRHAPSTDHIEIGFFGGEPLLEFPLLDSITRLIEDHPSYDPGRVSLTLTTNGTIFSGAIARFLRAHHFKVCVSCDGAPEVQNRFRRTIKGKETATLVERTLLAARQVLPVLLVNSVYGPQTLRSLPKTLDHLSGLGLRRIFLNADYSANWTQGDVDVLPEVYGAIANRYIRWYLGNDPHFVSLLDSKIAIVLRGGYLPLERCQMGTGELAITPDGGLYPCERLIGSGHDLEYRIGTLDGGLDLSRLQLHCAAGSQCNPECQICTLRHYCMNWCGCSNLFMSGYLNRVGAFLCASERIAVQTAVEVFSTLERQLGPVFLHHLSGTPHLNSFPIGNTEIP